MDALLTFHVKVLTAVAMLAYITFCRCNSVHGQWFNPHMVSADCDNEDEVNVENDRKHMLLDLTAM